MENDTIQVNVQKKNQDIQVSNGCEVVIINKTISINVFIVDPGVTS